MRRPDRLDSRPRQKGQRCPKCRTRLTSKSVPIDGVPWGTRDTPCCAECGWMPPAPTQADTEREGQDA